MIYMAYTLASLLAGSLGICIYALVRRHRSETLRAPSRAAARYARPDSVP